MTWQAQFGLAGRVGSLPLILAGPVLRQVTDSAVTVWVALKSPATVRLDVYPQDEVLGQPIITGSLATTALGTNLHMVAVTARATGVLDRLSAPKIYFYDLTFTGTAATPVEPSFSQALTRVGKPAITVASVFGCGSYRLPSFALPPAELTSLKLLHGSCRKPHGEGHDALAIARDLIERSCTSPAERPHQLLLTGDQIYADDVADGLLLMLTDASEVLLGWSETVAVKAGGPPKRIAEWPSYHRLPVLQAAGFTSDDLKSHLMSLGEYLSMYLFVWSDVLWPDVLPDFADVSAAFAAPFSAMEVLKATVLVQRHKPEIEKELRYVAEMRSTLPAVRKALANIPTYMICDDHEVTDDWNMTRRFCNRVYATPLGRRIVQNALVAFSLCQAWGNTPDRFAASPTTAGGTLLTKLNAVGTAPAGSRAGAYEENGRALQTVVGVHDADTVRSHNRVFHDPEASTSQSGENEISLRFDFRIEGSAHLVLVTDTRTWRAYPEPGLDKAADFLPGAMLTEQLSVDPGHPLGDRLLLVVLTTNAPPIASFRFATSNPGLVDVVKHPKEHVVAALGAIARSALDSPVSHGPDDPGKARAIYAYDLLESWEAPADSSDPHGRFDLLFARIESLVRAGSRKQALVLSGDVHSSFASRLTLFASPNAGTPLTVRMVVGQLVASPFKHQKDQTRGQQLEGYTYAPTEYARLAVPKHVPEAFAGPALTGVGGASVFRLDYLVSNPQQAPAVAIPDPLPVVEGEDVANLANYDAMVNMGRLVYVGASPLQMIGHNSLSEATFAQPTFGHVSARHNVHWLGPTGPAHTTTYDVSLDLGDPAYLKTGPPW